MSPMLFVRARLCERAAVAWFELNRVADESGEKSQYLVAATRGPEGKLAILQTCACLRGTRKRRDMRRRLLKTICAELADSCGRGAEGRAGVSIQCDGRGRESGHTG